VSGATPAVLLISPGILKWTDLDFGLPHLVSLGGYLREHTGVRVEILDLNYEGGDHAHLARTVTSLGPFLFVGLSAYSSYDYRRVMALARFLRDVLPGVPLVAGGYHASALPDDLVFDGSPFTSVVRGEGELPMRQITETLLGGGTLDRVYGPSVVADLDTLPPYQWDLLARYWPRATQLGRKFQIYLSRGCTYHCTFCMERAKSGYSWRAFSPDRALDELARLASFTDLSEWVINLADPLFGFHRRWRRQVLTGILERGLLPRQYWTLTRSDDLDEEDVSLLARARFSIGIGLESGSPAMLRWMQKGNTPERYLGAIQRLARLSRVHGLNWASNVIVGHPGETPETMRETQAFLTDLFTSAPETCGWLSIDPFRLYPGAQVHEQMGVWAEAHGTVFHHRDWWKAWYDGPFLAQHLEPSASLDYEGRVRFMMDAYAPLVAEVQRRFRGQGRSVDRVFARSLAEQRAQLSPTRRDKLIAQGRRALDRRRPPSPELRVPVGLHLKDPWVRRRESAVRRLLDDGVLRTASLIEAMLQTPVERYLTTADADAVLSGRVPETPLGRAASALPLRLVAMGLEALEPALGDTVADLTATTGYVAALLVRLVGDEGRVLAVHGGQGLPVQAGVEVVARRPEDLLRLDEGVDRLWIGAALPRLPAALAAALRPQGRAVIFLGPRFRPQDLVSLSRSGDRLVERRVARAQVPVLGGRHGWVSTVADSPPAVSFVDAPGPALGFHLLAHLPMPGDAAGLYDPAYVADWVVPLVEAWDAVPARVQLQGLLLQTRTIDDLVVRLRRHRLPALSGLEGQRLCRLFADVVEAERASFEAARRASAPARALVMAEASRLAAPIEGLRDRLWAARGVAPALTVLHVPDLGPRARGVSSPSGRVVAISLAEPADHVVMQVLHEEVHPLTDPIVLREHPGTRSTRPTEDGWRLHEALERTAVQATHAFLEAKASEWLPAFRAWCGSGSGVVRAPLGS
jgi:radical SAM superfamily enzyme YgiQ (UPF0313 family)/protein-L-isoaspartate O-methyltransferase